MANANNTIDDSKTEEVTLSFPGEEEDLNDSLLGADDDIIAKRS